MEKTLSWFFGMASLALISIAISILIINFSIRKNGIQTEGKVVKIQNQEVGTMQSLEVKGEFRKITLKFCTEQGDTCYFSPKTSSYKKAQLGDLMPLIYLSDKPKRAIIPDFKSTWNLFLFLFLLGLFFAGGARLTYLFSTID